MSVLLSAYLLLLIFVVGDYICRSKPPSLPSSPSPSRTSEDSRTQARSTCVLSRRPRTARRVCVRLARGGRLSPSCLRARACQCPSAHAVLAAFRRSRRWSGALSGLYIYPACRQAQGVHPLRSPPPPPAPPVLEPPRAMYV